MLKPRLFSYLSPEIVSACGSSLRASLALESQLPEPQRSLFAWLVDLLTETAKLEESNKMAPKNLAIVLSPTLLDFPKDNPIAGTLLFPSSEHRIHSIMKKGYNFQAQYLKHSTLSYITAYRTQVMILPPHIYLPHLNAQQNSLKYKTHILRTRQAI